MKGKPAVILFWGVCIVLAILLIGQATSPVASGAMALSLWSLVAAFPADLKKGDVPSWKRL